MSEAISTIGFILKGLGPVWRLVKFVRDVASKKYLLPHYEKSERLYLQMFSIGARWQPLSEFLEYSFQTVNSIDYQNGRRPSIGIRKNPNFLPTIGSVTLIVKAHSERYIEPERIVFEDIDETPQIHTFQNIPIDDNYFENGRRYESYEYISITVKDIKYGGTQLLNSPNVTTVHRTYFLFDITYIEKGGRIWNLWLFDLAEEQFKYYIKHLMDVDLIMPWWDINLWDWIRIKICNILTSPRILNKIFWTCVIFRVIDINDQGNVTSNRRWLSALERKLVGLRKVKVLALRHH
jgi:hypothetical protein